MTLNSRNNAGGLWTEVSPSGVSIGQATHAAQANVQHIITDFMIKSSVASNTVTFKTGTQLLGEFTIGAASVATPCNLVGNVGADVSAQLALSGTVSITGQSIKKA